LLPSSPNVPLDLGAAFIAACFLGVGGALATEYMRDTIDTPADLAVIPGFPPLAHVSLSGLVPAAGAQTAMDKRRDTAPHTVPHS
jgi:hypothetical protein